MNNNSSRYGKYLMLQFDLSGKIMGASIRTYLLEKTRVVRQNRGERNYHIFHLLSLGSGSELQSSLKLTASFNYLSTEADHRGTEPAKAFNEVKAAMASIGFDSTELNWVWTLCAVILKFGNITFGGGEEAAIGDNAVVSEIATHLRCDGTALSNALTTRRIKAGCVSERRDHSEATHPCDYEPR